MMDDEALVIPLHLHPAFQDRNLVQELKTALMAETLAYVQVALDNAARTTTSTVKILQRACALLDEARDRLECELGL